MTGRVRASAIAADTWRRLRRPLVPTLVSALIVTLGTVALFATTGLGLAGQQRVLDRINAPAGRLITVSDPQAGAGLSPETVDAVAALSGVTWAMGVGPAEDVRNPALADDGASVPARVVFGALPDAVRPREPRVLAPGQALAGPGLLGRLGMADGVGFLAGHAREATVVGTFTASAPLADLNEVVLVRPLDPAHERVRTIWVSVGQVSDLPAVADAVRAAVVADDPGAVRVETSADLAALGDDVVAELAASARTTLTGLLLLVAGLLGAVQFGRVAGMARDLGRRRALGASRHLIVVLVLLNAAATAALGATAGTVIGVGLTLGLAGAAPPASFCLALWVLMVLAGVTGAVLPALRAAHLDPVRTLRVP